MLRRAALGLWWTALGLLGLVRVAAKAAADPDWTQDPVTLAWLLGSMALGAVGVVSIRRALRPPRGSR
ncbi:hypothetical protein [Lysobacter sp. A3-1-A15]|uniref:hypothetical protein n=1 Tax=Novilysobacter viscosus TaxID=3098602 RepID=UPI002ED826C3